jgi:hypothetical protein
MSDVPSLDEITAESLRGTFPEWRIFRTAGAWWAIRGGIQEWEGPRSLLRRAVSAADLTALAKRLCGQEWLDGLDAEALAAVYRGDVTENSPSVQQGTDALTNRGGMTTWR